MAEISGHRVYGALRASPESPAARISPRRKASCRPCQQAPVRPGDCGRGAGIGPVELDRRERSTLPQVGGGRGRSTRACRSASGWIPAPGPVCPPPRRRRVVAVAPQGCGPHARMPGAEMKGACRMAEEGPRASARPHEAHRLHLAEPWARGPRAASVAHGAGRIPPALRSGLFQARRLLLRQVSVLLIGRTGTISPRIADGSLAMEEASRTIGGQPFVCVAFRSCGRPRRHSQDPLHRGPRRLRRSAGAE